MKPEHSPTGGEKEWGNLTLAKCKAVMDYLSQLQNLGVELPEGQTVEKLMDTNPGILLSYADRLYENDALWDALPHTLQVAPDVRKERILKARQYLDRLLSLGAVRMTRAELDAINEYNLDEIVADARARDPNGEGIRQGLNMTFDTIKRNLWTQQSIATARNRLHTLLQNCLK
jgi:hypothetical protein